MTDHEPDRTALTRRDRDLPSLTVLALLLSGPRHTWDVHRLMLATHKSFVTGLPRTLYYAVERLRADGHIEPDGVERQAGRPERTIYRITRTGTDLLRDRLRLLLATPDPDTSLLGAALSFASCLDADEAADVLGERVETIEHRLATTTAAPAELPRVLRIEDEFERARLEHERDWVRALVADIRSGDLPWPDLASLARLLPPPGGTDESRATGAPTERKNR